MALRTLTNDDVGKTSIEADGILSTIGVGLAFPFKEGDFVQKKVAIWGVVSYSIIALLLGMYFQSKRPNSSEWALI